MSGQYSTRRGPLFFGAGLIRGGNANHGVMCPVWTYDNGAYYNGSPSFIMGSFGDGSIPALADQDSFSLHARPANSVSLTTTRSDNVASKNIRLLAAFRNASNYIDAIVRLDSYQIWSGVLGDPADLASCAFPVAGYEFPQPPLLGEFLTFEIGHTANGTRTVLASTKVPFAVSTTVPFRWSTSTFGKSDLTLTVLPVYGTTQVSVLAMLRVAWQLDYSVAEQQASIHHWLTAEVESEGLGEFCGIGKPHAGGTFYSDVMFRSIYDPHLLPLRNDYQHDASRFGGVFQPKILLSGAEPDELGIITEAQDAQLPADMLPSNFEFKSRRLSSLNRNLPNGHPQSRNGRSDSDTYPGAIKAALTPYTALSQSVLAPPADGIPSWSNIAQSQSSLTVNISTSNAEFQQWLPASVVCQPSSGGIQHAATDCVYVGSFSGHTASRSLDQSLHNDGPQTMTTSGVVSVIAVPSFGTHLYWDGTKWTQRYRYAALFMVRISYQYFQSIHQPTSGYVTIGAQGVAVWHAALSWPDDGFVLGSGNRLYTADIPASGLIPSGESQSNASIRGTMFRYEYGEWQHKPGFERLLPPFCGSPQVTLS